MLLTSSVWTPTHTGFFDTDNNAEILWHNTSTGGTALWFMNGSNVVNSGNTATDSFNDNSGQDNDGIDVDNSANGNAIDSGNGNVVDSGNGNVVDSGNGSFNDNDGVDNDGGDNDLVDVDDSGNDSSTTDNSINDSGNDNSDNSDDDAIDVDADHSFQTDPVNVDNNDVH